MVAESSIWVPFGMTLRAFAASSLTLRFPRPCYGLCSIVAHIFFPSTMPPCCWIVPLLGHVHDVLEATLGVHLYFLGACPLWQSLATWTRFFIMWSHSFSMVSRSVSGSQPPMIMCVGTHAGGASFSLLLMVVVVGGAVSLFSLSNRSRPSAMSFELSLFSAFLIRPVKVWTVSMTVAVSCFLSPRSMLISVPNLLWRAWRRHVLSRTG